MYPGHIAQNWKVFNALNQNERQSSVFGTLNFEKTSVTWSHKSAVLCARFSTIFAGCVFHLACTDKYEKKNAEISSELIVAALHTHIKPPHHFWHLDKKKQNDKTTKKKQSDTCGTVRLLANAAATLINKRLQIRCKWKNKSVILRHQKV